MARVQNVEHAVGHHHFLAALARAATACFSSLRSSRQNRSQPGRTAFSSSIGENGGGTQFTDHHARRRVGKVAGLFQVLPEASVAASTPITVSPAPVTSYTSCA
jgi:hypothetical protein